MTIEHSQIPKNIAHEYSRLKNLKIKSLSHEVENLMREQKKLQEEIEMFEENSKIYDIDYTMMKSDLESSIFLKDLIDQYQTQNSKQTTNYKEATSNDGSLEIDELSLVDEHKTSYVLDFMTHDEQLAFAIKLSLYENHQETTE